MRVHAMLDVHGAVVHDTTAYTAKQRRKANRQQRGAGTAIDLFKLQREAEQATALRCTLSEQARNGTPAERVAASKAKRKLNDVWTNRRTKSLGEFWNPHANRHAK